MHAPINQTQRHYYETDPPTVEGLLGEQAKFVQVLQENGVDTHWVRPTPEAHYQIFVRDIATAIGDVLVVGSMKEPLRWPEPPALDEFLGSVHGPVVRSGAGVVEGGDIVLDGRYLYVGLSERTDEAGLDWLQSHFGAAFDILPIRLKPPFLHLDVVFNVLGDNLALAYPPAIGDGSLETLRARYKVIEVTENEQFELATNVLSLAPDLVIADSRHTRVGALLEACGIRVIAVDYAEVAKLGGSFRCSTCPLIRDPKDPNARARSVPSAVASVVYRRTTP
jgi:N-dimethylarginine dimethylaminohydrolase